MKTNIKIFSFCIVILLLVSSVENAFAESRGAIGWYCTRNRDHRQPIADAQLRYVEDYGGYYIDKEHGDENEEKVVYLTFDAGYENGNVERILDIMKAENVKGAFFVLGNLISKNTSLVRRMAEEGHTVCNHTNRHKDMTTVRNIEDFRAELEALKAANAKAATAQSVEEAIVEDDVEEAAAEPEPERVEAVDEPQESEAKTEDQNGVTKNENSSDT